MKDRTRRDESSTPAVATHDWPAALERCRLAGKAFIASLDDLIALTTDNDRKNAPIHELRQSVARLEAIVIAQSAEIGAMRKRYESA